MNTTTHSPRATQHTRATQPERPAHPTIPEPHVGRGTGTNIPPVPRAPRTPRVSGLVWNRAHWIGMIALTAVLAILVWGSSGFVIIHDGNNNWMTSPDRFVWLGSQLIHWPIALGLANLILGSIRTGSPSFPLASALLGPLGFGWANLRLQPGYAYPDHAAWLALMRSDGSRLVGQTLYGMVVLLVAYLAVAFLCYAIGRYGLRALFVDPDPRSASGRLLAWIRRDTVRFGCWLTVALAYGLMLALLVAAHVAGRGEAAMVVAVMINFVMPPMLLVVGGVYATRTAALAHPWRALRFPLVCSLVSVPLLIALIMPYGDVCPVASTCSPLGDGYWSWSAMGDVWHFTMVFAIASFLGFGAVWLVRRVVAHVRRTR